jgi:cobalt/nickel transport system permease protein
VTSTHDQGRTGPGRLRTPLTGLAPEAKIVGLVAFLVIVAVTPPSRPWALAGHAAIAACVAAAALVRGRDLVRRLAIDLPLVVLAATITVGGAGPRIDVFGVSLSRAGLQVGLALLAKATIGIVAVSAVAAATTASETVIGLRRLRLPGWICDLVALTARQVQVLGDELGRLRLAGAVRAGTGGRRAEWTAVARALGVLFVRGVERADRLQLALAARGGTALATPPATATATATTTATAATGTPTATPSATATAGTANPGAWLAALVPATAALALRLVAGR